MHLEVTHLLKEETYSKDDNAWFYSSRDPRFEFSNMSAGFPLKYRNAIWRSSEHLYQASKYAEGTVCIPETSKEKNNVIANVRDRIFHSKNAMGCKMTQKCAVAAGLVRKDWDQQLVHNMFYALQLKLHYNYDKLSRVFDQTGDQYIIEISRKDAFWGCFVQESQNGTLLVGQNVLGKLLMLIRDHKEKYRDIQNCTEPEKFFI